MFDFVYWLLCCWWAYLFDEMDYGVFVGKCVGVIGVGVFVMDLVVMVFEVGVVSVDMLICCFDLLCVNKGKGVGSLGFVYGYLYLFDVWKWCICYYINVE